MSILEGLRTSLEAIGRNKLRSALTMLGIVIGVAAVVALSAVGQGVEAMVSDSIQGIGSNLLTVQNYQSSEATKPAQLTLGDAEALADPLNAPSLSAVAPQITGKLRVAHEDSSATYTVAGTTQDMAYISNLNMAAGGFLTRADVQDKARVAVLGANVYNELFGEGEYAIDQSITLDGTRFRVVGVLKAKGGILNEDDRIYVPISTAQARFYTQRTLSGDYPVSVIMAAAASPEAADAASQQIEATLRERHDIADDKENDFRVTNQQDLLDMSSEVTGIITIFLSVVAGISLLVGGIGIMNIMLVTVTERTREIGIRKAIGATNAAIMGQFLVEALVLTLVGGVLGMGLGIAASSFMSTLMDLTPRVAPEMLALAAGISSLVGLVFGVYPAMRAAQLRPIQALRYE